MSNLPVASLTLIYLKHINILNIQDNIFSSQNYFFVKKINEAIIHGQ